MRITYSTFRQRLMPLPPTFLFDSNKGFSKAPSCCKWLSKIYSDSQCYFQVIKGKEVSYFFFPTQITCSGKLRKVRIFLLAHYYIWPQLALFPSQVNSRWIELLLWFMFLSLLFLPALIKHTPNYF